VKDIGHNLQMGGLDAYDRGGSGIGKSTSFGLSGLLREGQGPPHW